MSRDVLDRRERVGDLGVDLTRVRIALVGRAQLGERNTCTGEHLEHDERGDDARVRPVVVAEVVVARVLTAEGGPGLGHDGLDVGVPDPGADRRATVLDDDLGYGLRADQVVQHGRAGVPLEHGGGDDRGGERAGEQLALVVDEEHPIGIAVEGEADVGTGGEHARLEIDLVLGLDGVGRMVRERAVELAVEDIELEGQTGEHGGSDEATHPVGGVGHDLERSELRHVDERVDVVDEGRQGILAGRRSGGRDRREPGEGVRTDDLKARLHADRLGAGEAQLDAVVLRRVVRRGELGTRCVEVPRREEELVGRRQAQVDDIDAL